MKNQVTSQMSSPSSETQSSAVRGPGTKSAARCAAVFLDPRRLCLPAAGRGDDASEAGNIFVWIFIMVALFGALSFAMMQGTRSSAGQLTDQQASLAATSLLEYSNSIKNAVKTLKINGCSDNQISFVYDSNRDGVLNASDDYYNATAPTDNRCNVFHPQGGGLMPQNPEPEWLDTSFSVRTPFGVTFFTGRTCIGAVGSGASNCNGDALDNEELILFTPFIKKEICEDINEKLGLAAIYQDNVSAFPTSTPYPKFDGTYANGNALNDTGSNLWGRLSGCFEGDAHPPTGSYTFFNVLIPR